MIGGQHQHQRIRVALLKPDRCGQNGGSGIARLGFDQDTCRGHFDSGELFDDEETERFTGYYKRSRKLWSGAAGR